MNIHKIQQEIIEEFSFFDDWMQRYEYIIELGKSLEPFPENQKKDNNLIKGCQSKVWLHASYKDNLIKYQAESDAILTKGIIALLIRVFSNKTPQEVIDAPTNFIDSIGLKEHLSPTRANGLVSMIKQIKLYALAFQNKK